MTIVQLLVQDQEQLIYVHIYTQQYIYQAAEYQILKTIFFSHLDVSQYGN